MPPADTDRAAATRVRCEGCLDVLASRHAWDSRTCRCGALTVSGPPRRPRISWTGHPGTGWSEVTEVDADVESDDQPVPGTPAVNRLASLGYGARVVTSEVAQPV